MADTTVLEAVAERCAGSSPVPGTKIVMLRAVVGTLLLGILASDWRYAHLMALRFDEVAPALPAPSCDATLQCRHEELLTSVGCSTSIQPSNPSAPPARRHPRLQRARPGLGQPGLTTSMGSACCALPRHGGMPRPRARRRLRTGRVGAARSAPSRQMVAPYPRRLPLSPPGMPSPSGATRSELSSKSAAP